MRDPYTLSMIIRYCLVAASIFTTSFPLLYSFSPWHSSMLGRLLMLQGVSFASMMDLLLLFQYWQPKNILVVFWLSFIVLGAITISTGSLTWKLWRMNHSKWITNSETGERFLRRSRSERV